MHYTLKLLLRFTVCLALIAVNLGIQAQEHLPVEATWKGAKKNGSGTLVAYWYESRPFIYKTAKGMEGIEYEILEGFRNYLKETQGIALTIVWKEGQNFGDTYVRVRDDHQRGVIGASSFSFTPEREKEVDFSVSYMPDISVLITSKDIPIVQTRDEFNKVFSKLTAVAIEATTYEEDIMRIKKEGNLPFQIDYIPADQNILKAIEARDSAFGFIDLPIYMMMFMENPSIKVKRQNLFPVKRKGYAFIYPRQSDWVAPLNTYLSSPKFESDFETIIAHYFDIDLYHFIESLAVQSNDLVALLTKEKELQYNDLLGKSMQIEKETRTRNFLIALVSVIFFFLITIILLYRKRSEQKKEIEIQRRSIELKNEQLEKHNRHLVALDEEKNNLIKILAHDLRTPINHVQGLTEVLLLNHEGMPEEQKMIIQRINDATLRLNKMISNILDIDSLERNRVSASMDEVMISPLIDQVARSFDKQAAKKNITISTVSMPENVRVKGDALLMIQIFENLVSNALKFSEKGKTVEIITEVHRETIRIGVKDSGPGLTEEDQKLLFKKFQRLSARPTDGENSTGLGLSIVKNYVELMDGKVWCESESGKGASFIVEFKKTV